MELTLTTPALLFSAISLIMLAYTNRFLSYASLVRSLHDKYVQTKSPVILWQIKNLRTRLYLTRSMQISGILSLLLCVVSMFLIYITLPIMGAYVFAVALLLLIISLALLIREIQISVHALDLHLKGIEDLID
ncbi:MAG: DUF2721 domain-containing protein [Bacteroidales bacterium]|nr:DUF2721 domain-containing protein [Bacteroidales bacterium]NLK81525.1 DUF2721 domain-containing protein [Bacteroidales bacterium]